MPLKRIKATHVGHDDLVILYPTFGHLTDGDDTWRIHVCGTVYEDGAASVRHRLLLRLLQKVMKVQPTDMEQPLFKRRIRAFIAPTERGKRVSIRVGDRVHRLQKCTRRNGRFYGTLRLTDQQICQLQQGGQLDGGWLKLGVVRPSGESPQQEGRVRLMENTGISVISDIDDTIKLTEVHSRRSLLANTFLREFREIDGMAPVYLRWADQGATFHYVSSSPWQLYDSLAEHMQEVGFPPGTFHLRSFRLRDHMLRRILLIRRRGKVSAIRSLLRTFPQRRFALVGDSGEIDPEIYGALARKYFGQVVAIYIRELPERPMDDERVRKAFRYLPTACWRIFRSPRELPAELPSELGFDGQPFASLRIRLRSRLRGLSTISQSVAAADDPVA
jgi:hypothetical protein